jgi:tetratricopeptide (TPR) repeat protein
MAEAALADGMALADGVAVSTAERALGMAARELDDLPAATVHLRRAIRVARRARATRAEALARGRLAGTLFLQGKSTQALREAERAAPHLRGLDAARLRVQRALFLQRLGRTAEALEEYRVAMPILRRGGAAFEEVQALVNRGILHAYRGEYGAAEADLRRAEGLGPQIGPGLPIGMIHANLGFVAARRGDVPAALALYDLAERELPTTQVAMALLDRCETLLAVRLVPEARLAAEEAAGRLEAAGRKSDLAEARLMVAQAALLDGDGRSAEEAATRARRAFLAQRRPGWAT